MKCDMSDKTQKQSEHSSVIHIDELLDQRAKRQQKINEIKKLVDSGAYKIQPEKLSQVIAKNIFPEEE